MQKKDDARIDVEPYRSSVRIDDSLRAESRRREASRVDPADLAWLSGVISQLHLVSVHDLEGEAKKVAVGDLDGEMQILFLNSGLSSLLDS